MKKAVIDKSNLVDIRDIQIDQSLPVESRIKSYVEQVKNPYLFKVGDVTVHISYSDTAATLNDKFIDLLLKKGN